MALPFKCKADPVENDLVSSHLCSFDCNDTPAQKWVIDNCKKKIRLADKNFCLDATNGGTYVDIYTAFITNNPSFINKIRPAAPK